MPVVLPLMRPHEYSMSALAKHFRVFVGPKADGVRCQLYQGKAYTRTGEKIYGADEVAQAVARVAPSWVVEGEFYHPELDFDTISGMVRDHNAIQEVKFYMFDIPNLNEPYQKRRKAMRMLLNRVGIKTMGYLSDFVITARDEYVQYWYKHFLEEGYEGVMVKTMGHMYQNCRPSKRSWDWMRLKPEFTADAIVIDVIEGRGKYRNAAGAFRVQDRAGLRFKCGGGTLTDTERFRIFREPAETVGKGIEFSYQRRNRAGGYRHPRFKKWRTVDFTN